MAEITVNKDILAWSIGRAGFKKEELNKQFPNLSDWLSEKRKPTIKQLESFSKKVHLPFGYFFLDQPPVESIPFPFFRSKGSKQYKVSLNLFDTIRLIESRQQWLSDYLKELDQRPLEFVGSFTSNANPNEIVSTIRNTLGLQDLWATAFTKVDDAINHITEKIEDKGIVMTFNGVVENSNSRPLSVSECRGFVIVDSFAPFMFINNADWKAAQMFTIVHELAHIWLGRSAGFENDKLLPADDYVEKLCDRVAAEFLVPSNAFLNAWKIKPDIQSLTRTFKVSRIVIARRAFDLGKISQRQFFNYYNSFASEAIRKKEASGGNFYSTQKKRVGLRFASYVERAVSEERLLYRDAYKLTGLRGDTYENFMKKFLRA